MRLGATRLQLPAKPHAGEPVKASSYRAAQKANLVVMASTMTIATRNGCHLCVAMHTARLAKLEADAALIAALRSGSALADGRLDAIRVFTLRVLDTTGDVGDDALKAFLGHGYTERNALEVVLGIGAYTMSTLANRLTGAPIDEPLRQFA